jgi:hypothetical protein
MTSVHGGDPEQLWFRTLQQLRGRHGIDKARRLLGILEVAPFMSVGRSDKGCMVFMLAYVKLQRCTAARREISLAQERVRVLWRVPGTPYTEFEKHSLFGPVYVDVDE